MSHAYDTSTYIAEAAHIPARLESPDQLRALVNAAFSQQKASPNKLVYVSGATRSGWGIYTVKALLEALDLPSLGFLSDQGQHRFDTEHGYTCVSILDGAGLSRAAADIKKLLDLVRANPMLAMDADTDGSFIDVDHVAKALARDYVSSSPAYDYENVQGDEGQGADYLFTWLRSVQRVVEGAISDGRAVIHVLVV
jgi:hypothetical protein